ncbi:anti-sigma factor antagonist [Alteromonas sediminis]|uniref:Anti-sigma factor antagonist n=1 Tax=Alteromonas sediminis TaxID=2259342 RepID=A0A3N5Y5M4_9ALTE|nr:STAS domain-containing protein [Alteromonas sediminis]RPJ68543.1 anti-sigma factor antagonist [Alteromonas sediminis]
MSIEKSLSADGTTLTIKMDSKFDFSKVKDFRETYDDVGDELTTIIVDLSRTEYMDSSALGMMLNMQKTLSGRPVSYKIQNCQEQVARILKISRFDKKFDIS